MAISLRIQTLNTPLEIYDAARRHFSATEARLTSTAPVVMELTLRPGSHSVVRLDAAVDKTAFLTALQSLSLFGQSHSPPLDSGRFSTQLPLSDWPRFRRVMYEQSGASCSVAILDYLRHPSGSSSHTIICARTSPRSGYRAFGRL